MARPRTFSDRQILDATLSCVTEHGPGVSLSVIGRRLGVSAGTLVKRFGSKEGLVFQALLPRERPDWAARLQSSASGQGRDVLVQVLVEVCESFDRVGPALAALRMTAHGTAAVFPPGAPGPPVRLRAAVAAHLRHHELVPCDADVAADLLLGVVEARGFLGWVGPQMVAEAPDLRSWVTARVDHVLGGRPATRDAER